MEHLDARLGTIAAMTPRCRAVADIGCDHGLLIAVDGGSIYLSQWSREGEDDILVGIKLR